MSKPIKVTSKYLEDCMAEFQKILSGLKLSDGKISYQKTIQDSKEKATIYFTNKAWIKMTTLLSQFNKEVAWHGVASRINSDKHYYLISDIVVYPQSVTGASVEMDESKYSQWIFEHIKVNDERFDNLFMQGHSHVNMAVSPSSVDLQHQEDILKMTPEDGFYIFMIWNKGLDRNLKIYDLGKNILFENKDIEIDLYEDGIELAEFLVDAKKQVVDRGYTYVGSGYKSVGSIAAGVKTSAQPKEEKNNKTQSIESKDSRKGKKKVKIEDFDAGYNPMKLYELDDDYAKEYDEYYESLYR